MTYETSKRQQAGFQNMSTNLTKNQLIKRTYPLVDIRMLVSWSEVLVKILSA